ncbi:unnamed protein product [Dicrocoelium dendriticum]|nr:unnamed protein product [Dicrocoelium dendriticum]
MCMTPFFNTGSFTPNFLIEYIELQRRLGITLLALYLAEQPTAGVKKVIESYRNQPSLMPGEMIEIRTVPWNLPVPNPSETTWYYDQVLSFNDCLHRLANDTEYIFYGDLDEIFIPDRHLGLNKSTLPTWFDVISAVTGDYGPSHPTLCFPSRFFPPMLEITSNNENIFARTIATVDTYPERRKCLVRTQDVEEVYVHWPVKPSVMRLAESLGVIFHYRTCLRKGYIPCELSTKYSVNTQLQPYRDAVRRSVEFRLTSL